MRFLFCHASTYLLSTCSIYRATVECKGKQDCSNSGCIAASTFGHMHVGRQDMHRTLLTSSYSLTEMVDTPFLSGARRPSNVLICSNFKLMKLKQSRRRAERNAYIVLALCLYGGQTGRHLTSCFKRVACSCSSVFDTAFVKEESSACQGRRWASG
jgi:hypothetical protein